jgi:PAS domain-containing protein
VLDALLIALLSAGAVYVGVLFAYRKKEKLLVESKANEKRFRELTALSADWFWETDTEHRIVWISGGAPVATFFGQISTYGKRFWEIPQIEVEPRSLEAHRERLENQLPFFDLEIARTDERGARQIHIISGRSRFDAQRRFVGYRGVGRDITEQRSAEHKLFQAKGRLELALDGGNLAE